MMSKLSPPSPGLKGRITGRVGFERRLTGRIVHLLAGEKVIDLYSFRDALHFMQNPIRGVDHSALVTWIRDVIGDPELADRMQHEAERSQSRLDRSLRLWDLMRERFEQCVGDESAPADV
jgi:hypothetical protein